MLLLSSAVIPQGPGLAVTCPGRVASPLSPAQWWWEAHKDNVHSLLPQPFLNTLQHLNPQRLNFFPVRKCCSPMSHHIRQTDWSSTHSGL